MFFKIRTSLIPRFILILTLLGALASIDTGTRGTYYFDAFESER